MLSGPWVSSPQAPGAPSEDQQLWCLCTTAVVVRAQGNCGRKLSHSVLGMKSSLLAHLHIVKGMSWNILCSASFSQGAAPIMALTGIKLFGEINRKPPCTPSLYSKENFYFTREIRVRYFVKHHTILIKTSKPLIQTKVMPYKVL